MENYELLLEIEKLDPKFLQVKFKNQLRVIKKNCPFDGAIEWRDVSIAVRVPQEDEVFAMNPELWLNIRRGNTIIDFYDDEDKYDFSTVGRKGLNKFFDMSISYLKPETRHDFSIDKKQKFDQSDSNLLKNQILLGAK